MFETSATRPSVCIPVAVILCIALANSQRALADDLHARYLANAGVMIQHAESTILFDPLFRNDYGRYELVPEDVERALFDAEPPFEDIDAVFVSHHHGDHFDPAVMLDFLVSRPEVQLYGPAQAVDAIIEHGADDAVSGRMTRVLLAYGDQPQSFQAGDLTVSAVRIPHSGWPERRADVENIAWRVTLDGAATVLHLGDADTRPTHFNQHVEYWQDANTDLALPPYWYFLSTDGRAILDETIGARYSIGVHVPQEVPASRQDWPEEFRGADLFTTPGEERRIAVGEPE